MSGEGESATVFEEIPQIMNVIQIESVEFGFRHSKSAKITDFASNPLALAELPFGFLEYPALVPEECPEIP